MGKVVLMKVLAFVAIMYLCTSACVAECNGGEFEGTTSCPGTRTYTPNKPAYMVNYLIERVYNNKSPSEIAMGTFGLALAIMSVIMVCYWRHSHNKDMLPMYIKHTEADSKKRKTMTFTQPDEEGFFTIDLGSADDDYTYHYVPPAAPVHTVLRVSGEENVVSWR